MKILAFDTSSAASSVALFCDEHIYAYHEPQSVKQGTHLLPIIADLLTQAGLTLKELDAVALGVGPGSFTGLRIGCSAAQAIGVTYHLPLIPISSLQLLAQTAHQRYGGNHFLVAVDARKEQSYCGQYEFQSSVDSVRLVGNETLVSLSGQDEESVKSVMIESRAANNLHEVVSIGNAWGAHKERLLTYFNVTNSPSVYFVDLLPTASAMLALVKTAYKGQQWLDAQELSPRYLNDIPFSVIS